MTDALLDLDGIGQRSESFRFDVLDIGGSVIGTIVPTAGGSIENNTNRDIKRTLTGLRLPEADWMAVNWLTDRIRPMWIAENGAVVPVSVTTTLADVTSISFLVSENPVALVATYRIPTGTLPNVANRIKMAKTSNVIVVVEAGGKLYSANKEVKVTVGGCGG